MTGSSIEAALNVLYRDGTSVRRKAWDSSTYIKAPKYRFHSPVLVDSEGERIYVPKIKDFLVTDWESLAGTDLTKIPPEKNGIYRGIMYAFVTGKPIAILGWYPSTKVFVEDTALKIQYLANGVEQVTDYIPTREDYLSKEWTPYMEVKDERDQGNGNSSEAV